MTARMQSSKLGSWRFAAAWVDRIMRPRRSRQRPPQCRVATCGRAAPTRRVAGTLAIAVSCASLLGCAEADVAPRSALEMSVPPSDLVGREAVSPTEERIRVRGDGREIPAIVLLPDDYGRRQTYPAVLAVHNFGSGPGDFAGLIDAERLRRAGVIVILPQAAGLVAEWQGPGISLTFARRGEDGRPVDDIAGLIKLSSVAQDIYRVDPADLNLAGFSQGATLALELTRQLDVQRPGTVRRVFAVAGSVVNADRDTLAFPGTDIVHYEPGRNGLQVLANLRTGEPAEAAFMPWIVAAKGCELRGHTDTDGVDTQIYSCRDGRNLTRIYEQYGEHAWPGQAAKYDIWLFGRGSISQVKFTELMLSQIVPFRGE